MISRLAIFCGFLCVLMAGVAMSQPRYKRNHVVVPEVQARKVGDRVLAANNELLARIPNGFVDKLLSQPRANREKEFAHVLSIPGMEYRGWTHTIKTIGTEGAATTLKVYIEPHVLHHGVSTTVCGGIEEVYRFENGELTLVSSKVVGSPKSWLRD